MFWYQKFYFKKYYFKKAISKEKKNQSVDIPTGHQHIWRMSSCKLPPIIKDFRLPAKKQNQVWIKMVRLLCEILVRYFLIIISIKLCWEIPITKSYTIWINISHRVATTILLTLASLASSWVFVDKRSEMTARSQQCWSH